MVTLLGYKPPCSLFQQSLAAGPLSEAAVPDDKNYSRSLLHFRGKDGAHLRNEPEHTYDKQGQPLQESGNSKWSLGDDHPMPRFSEVALLQTAMKTHPAVEAITHKGEKNVKE